MNRPQLRLPVVASLAALALAAGCQTSGPSVGTNAMPQITRLYQKASAPKVHRFRKPVRDEHARICRLLASECARLIADVGTWESSGELTATDTAGQDALRTDIRTLRSSLEQLRHAATVGNANAMRSAHSSATSSYTRIGHHMELPRP